MSTPTKEGSPFEPAITFEDVWMGFDEGQILQGVTFQVQERETLILLGETGTGKTLTLKMAAGLLTPNSGRVIVLGNEVSEMNERELLPFRRKVGFVFQEGALFDSMSVAENVAYRLREDRVAEEEIEPRVLEVLRFVELEHTLELLPSELSGGMRRRVSIARALINRPPIVLYDSPTAGLDPMTSQTIIRLILRLRDVYGVTALLATQRNQAGGSQRAKWERTGVRDRGENALSGLPGRWYLFRRRTRGDCQLQGPISQAFSGVILE
jgi:phospholipid/cholesterol/gamma-HCH transport system ATP-binding protein